jgi:hypothetical protein
MDSPSILTERELTPILHPFCTSNRAGAVCCLCAAEIRDAALDETRRGNNVELAQEGTAGHHRRQGRRERAQPGLDSRYVHAALGTGGGDVQLDLLDLFCRRETGQQCWAATGSASPPPP